MGAGGVAGGQVAWGQVAVGQVAWGQVAVTGDRHSLNLAAAPDPPLLMYQPQRQVGRDGRQQVLGRGKGEREVRGVGGGGPRRGYARHACRFRTPLTLPTTPSPHTGVVDSDPNPNPSNISEDMGVIASSRAATLPCEEGLSWQWGDASGGHDDGDMVCTAGEEAAATWAAEAELERARLAAVWASAPGEVTLSGRVGKWQKLMGT